jgi:hypothetical protein
MAADVEPRQYWVRSENKKTWGPLTFATLDLFVANKIIFGRCQVSVDGVNFADPGRYPDVRDAFPQELWGSTEVIAAEASSAPVLRQGPPTLASGAKANPGGDRSRPAAAAGPPVMARPTSPAVERPKSSPGATPAQSVAAAPAVLAPAPNPAALSGELGEESAFRVYYRLVAATSTGAWKLTAHGVSFELFLKKGVPQHASSSSPEDSVVQHLGEKGLLPAEAVVQAEAAAAQFGGDAVAAAFALGLVQNPGELVAAMTGHGVELFKKLLRLTEGIWIFDPAAPAPATATALGHKWGLMMQAGRTLTGDEARRRLGPRLDAPVMKSGHLVTLEELQLVAQEARVAAAFEGVRSLAQLGESLADADGVARTGYLLGEVELAGFAQVRTPAPSAAPPPVAAKPVTAAVAAKPVTAAVAAKPATAPVATKPATAPVATKPASAPRPAVAAKPAAPPVMAPAAKPVAAPVPPAKSDVNTLDPAALKAHLEKITKQTHFEVLGLKPEAAGASIKLAYLGAVKVFHPDTTPADALPEVRPLREKIFTRINDANIVLSDDKARAAYLEELENGPDEKVDIEAIFKAEDLFTRGTIVCKARKYSESVPMFEEAIKLNDKEAEFHAWLAFARFMNTPDRKSALSAGLEGVERALALQPKCAQAAYFAGQMMKLVGDAQAAGKWFKKTLEIDANHLDAQRELRLIK